MGRMGAEGPAGLSGRIPSAITTARPAWRARVAPVAALIIFAALAVLLFGSAWAHPGGAWIGDGRDPHLFIWYLGWTPRQLAGLRNPLFTTVLQAPGGANLMWNTAVLA